MLCDDSGDMGGGRRGRVTVVGGGAMGVVCALLLDLSGHDVWVYANRRETADALAADRENRRLLPGVRLPDGVTPTSDLAAALDGCSMAVNAVPTQHTRQAFEAVAPHLPAGVPVVSCAKGIELDTLMRPSEVIAQTVGGGHAIAVMSGPNIAAELGRRQPATAVSASADPALAARVQRAFGTGWFRLYTSDDVLGVEFAGAVKNVIALAAGMLDGLDGGYNAKAGLVTRGLVEITRLGAAVGARPSTFNGLAGLGDLITTCFSPSGRNRYVGEQVARGRPVGEVLAGLPSVAEGVPTTRALREVAAKHGVEMPILEAVHAILFEAKPIPAALNDLMTRDPKPERVAVG